MRHNSKESSNDACPSHALTHVHLAHSEELATEVDMLAAMHADESAALLQNVSLLGMSMPRTLTSRKLVPVADGRSRGKPGSSHGS